MDAFFFVCVIAAFIIGYIHGTGVMTNERPRP